MYDLRGENFPYFELSGFTRTDQAASADVLTVAKSGDLVVRDLGYFSIRVFQKMIDNGIHFLSRLRHGVSVFDPVSLKPIDLLSHLKRYHRFDQKVLIGATNRVPIRLVALPVPVQVANERRRKARKNRDRRCNPSKEHLEMLAWSIFITSVPDSIWTSETVEQVYRMRWRIELIFKSWKSHFNLTQIPTGSVYQLEVLIWAKLLGICLFQNLLGTLDLYYSRYSDARASLLKTAQFFRYFLVNSIGMICPTLLQIELVQQHLRVEKKKKNQPGTVTLLLS